MSSRWFWFLYPSQSAPLDPSAGLARLSSTISLDHLGVEVLHLEFTSNLDRTVRYEVLRSNSLDIIIDRLCCNEHLHATLRFDLARVEFYSYHRAVEDPVILLGVSTHESSDTYNNIAHYILTLGFYSNAAYLVVASEAADLSHLSRFSEEAIQNLTRSNIYSSEFGHGIHDVYINSDFGGRPLDFLINMTSKPVGMGYQKYSIPGSFSV